MNISIGNYSVNNVNWFKEHEGLDAFQCDILYNGTKIGYFSQSYMNGPDEYKFIGKFDEEIKKIRETATKFFSKYSKDEDLINDRFSCNEDFFIRFLQSLKESCEVSQEGQEIEISTTYPFNYEIYDKRNNLELTVNHGINENRLIFPVVSSDINIDLKDKEVEHGLN